MLVNLGLIALCWIALRFEKKDLRIFGFQPLPMRLFQFILGFFLTAALFTCINLIFGYSADFSWVRNDNYGLRELGEGAYKTFNSVVLEELVFRSYLLYKLFQLLGEKWAVLITSCCFGMYHWFTFGLLGNYPMMVWIFFYTWLWGLMFAYSYTRTGTILLPIGLHWGWNFFDQLIFEKNGDGMFKPLTSGQTIFLSQSKGFLITTLPTIVFAVIVILYFVRRRTVEVGK